MRNNLFKVFEDPSGKVLLKEMDEAGIDVTVLNESNQAVQKVQ